MAGGIGGPPEPTGSPNGPGLWHHKGLMLPTPVQHVARALMREGHPRSQAIAIAVGAMKRWARGGGHVHAKTRAIAAAGVADWEAKRGLAHVASVGRDIAGARSSGRVSSGRSARREGERAALQVRMGRVR